jgi:hypothetical protein
VEVRQREAEKYRPEVYVVPERGAKAEVGAAIRKRLAAAAATWPGLELQDLGGEFRIGIPDRYRVGHEAHFGQVTRQFLNYLEKPSSLPVWENPNMLAKYRVTTQGTALSHGKL